jgi:hypothetical protein
VLKKGTGQIKYKGKRKGARKEIGKYRQRGGRRLVKRGDEEEFEGGRNG